MGDYSNIMLATPEEFSSGKRLSEIVNGLAVAHPPETLCRTWIAVRLSDGGTDGVLYDSRLDAVRHQPYEKQCAYIQLKAAIGGMEIREAIVYLKFHRDAYDKGYVFIDPEHPTGGFDMRMPIANEDVRHQMSRLRTARYNGRKKR